MTDMSIKLMGAEYPLRFTLRAVRACTERYGSLTKMFEAISGSEAQVVSECLWLLETMLDAGYRYADRNGLAAPMPPEEEALLDVLDLETMRAAIAGAIAGDSRRTVEAEVPKNGGDAEAAAAES